MCSGAWHQPCFLWPSGSSAHMGVLVWRERFIPHLSVCVVCHLSLLPGHFTWGSDTAVLGASFQASPHSDFPVFLQFHFTSKSLDPMRSALMCSGKQESRLSFSDVVQSLPHCICPHLLLDFPFCSSDRFCCTTSSCLCGAVASGVQWERAWHIAGIGG